MSGIAYSASVMCANLGRLEEDIRSLEAAGCDELHFDIMDGLFVPNFTLGSDFVAMARRVSPLPCSAHLMVTHPEHYIERFVEAGCASVTVHIETCIHAQRTLTQIRDAGASPGIALNPATPLTKIDYLLEYADRVLVMAVDSGYAGQTIINTAFERVRILGENIRYRELPCRIEVDGNITVENAALLARMGARIFVLGTASIFKGTDGDLGAAFKGFRDSVAAQAHLV